MRAVENGVHLIIRERAVRASKGSSGFIWVSKVFSSIATIPAFAQTVSKDSGTRDGTVTAKEVPTCRRVREICSNPARRKLRVPPEGVSTFKVGGVAQEGAESRASVVLMLDLASARW